MSAASFGACSRVGATFLSLALALSMSGGRADGRARGLEPQAARPALACPPSRVANGHDYRGLTLTLCSFSGQDLTNASFVGATLIGVLFIKTNLTGADFTDVTFADSGFAQLPTDFTFANLTRARFVGSKFNGLTYLTYATLSCADFSSPDSGTTDLSNGNAVFGDAPLDIDPKDCRPNFRGATMTCEFVAQWKLLDMSGARITGCTDQGKGQDFSGGNYSNVVFDGLDLSGSKWNGAVLEYASFQGATLDNASGLNGTSSRLSKLSATRFNNASLQNVDLSHAELYGAQFTNANLTNSSFDGSFLQANTSVTPPIETAAVFDGAHLRNVTFANAHLSSVKFRFASLYGTFGGDKPTFPCPPANNQCEIPTGSTCACATASGADLSATDFSNAYLYGVDFGRATINGTNFGSAILAGANFSSAQFRVNGGAAPDFTKALLQGATFDQDANLVDTGLLDAFVDFGKASNQGNFNVVFLLLTSDYTGFRGWTGSKRPCVAMSYGSFTTVPPNASMTCPSGNATVCGAGNTPASLAHWKSAIAMANNSVPGLYYADATYDDGADTNAVCTNNATVDPKW
ncbi:MAG: pentapeptide repeat-containing protein [Caldimonas sp.]